MMYGLFMLTKDDLSAIKKVVKGEVQSSEKRINTKIEKVQESVDIVQEVVVKHYSKLEQRVSKIEEEIQVSRN